MDHDPIPLTKHHGAGNDFLVLVDPDDRRPVAPELVRALCDRRFGVGADGLLRVLAGRDGTDLAMELHNADGSPAEMSGNGIRCLAQAAVDAGLVAPPSFTVWTEAGVRTLEYETTGLGAADASVEMGKAELGPDLLGRQVRRWGAADRDQGDVLLDAHVGEVPGIGLLMDDELIDPAQRLTDLAQREQIAPVVVVERAVHGEHHAPAVELAVEELGQVPELEEPEVELHVEHVRLARQEGVL